MDPQAAESEPVWVSESGLEWVLVSALVLARESGSVPRLAAAMAQMPRRSRVRASVPRRLQKSSPRAARAEEIPARDASPRDASHDEPSTPPETFASSAADPGRNRRPRAGTHVLVHASGGDDLV